MKIGIALLIVAVVVVFVVPGLTDRSYKTETNEPEEVMFTKEGSVAILDSLGKERVKIDAEFADPEYDRQRGLMFRKTMPRKARKCTDSFTPGRRMPLQTFWAAPGQT